MSDTTPSASGAADNGTSACAVTITGATTYRGRRIQELERERDDLRKALHTVLTTGKSYTLSNSHAVTRADVEDLQSRLSAVNQELASLMTRTDYQPLRREPTKFY